MTNGDEAPNGFLRQAGFNPQLMNEKMQALLAQMPKPDQQLVLAMMDAWGDSGHGTAYKRIIGAFDTAKNLLPMGKQVVTMLYSGDYVPAPLRNIMLPFITGTATQAETEKRLDDCKAVLKKWLPQMFGMLGLRQ